MTRRTAPYSKIIFVAAGGNEGLSVSRPQRRRRRRRRHHISRILEANIRSDRLCPPSSNAVPVGAPPTKISHRAPLPRVSTSNPTLRVRDGGWMGHQRNENGAVQLSSKNPHKVALKEEEEGVTQPLEESLASLRRKERSVCGSE